MNNSKFDDNLIFMAQDDFTGHFAEKQRRNSRRTDKFERNQDYESYRKPKKTKNNRRDKFSY